MKNTIGWGILGAGSIANRFAQDLQKVPEARLAAVGSRTADKAAQFAEKWGAARAHGSYEDLAADPDVDVIYVATPHPLHCANTVLCLEHGKAVLCEKPMAINAGEVRAMVECARNRKLFLMEAMWARFNPVLVQVRRWLAEGQIGEVRLLNADFGFRANWDPQSRLLNPALGGGAVLDVGIYVTALASMVFGGAPSQVKAVGLIGETGVDEQTAMLYQYASGGIALLSCAVRTVTPHVARISGSVGSITIPDFWRATRATLQVAGQEPVEATGTAGYEYEAAEVMACLRQGNLESTAMPLDESIEIADTLDQVRAQIGLKYPTE
jgi:predicted dehydrogenase